MKQFFHSLNQPFPFTARPRDSFAAIAAIAGFVFVFVFIFQSQIMEHESLWFRALFAFCYGAMTFFIAIINSILLGIKITQKQEEGWKVKYEILLYLINFGEISIGNYFITQYFTQAPVSFFTVFQSFFVTIVVGAIPISIAILIQQRNKYKKFFALAHDITTQQNSFIKSDLTSVEPLTTNTGSSQIMFDETLRLSEHDILYIESDKNYLRVKLSSGDEIRVRQTLKEIQERHADMQLLRRVHRAYMVNTQQVASVDGNAQGLKLQLHNCQDTIPVSRSYISDFKSALYN